MIQGVSSEGISPHILPDHCSDYSVLKYNSHDQRQHELCPAVTLDIPSCEDALASAIGWCTAGFAYNALASAYWRMHRRICIWRSGLYTELWADIGHAISRSQRRVPCSRNAFSAAQHIQTIAPRRYFSLQCRWQWKLTFSVRTTATRRSAALPWIRMSQQVLSIWREKCSMFSSVSGLRPFKCTIKVSQFLIHFHFILCSLLLMQTYNNCNFLLSIL